MKWINFVRSESEYLGKLCKIVICRDITESVSTDNSRKLLINALNNTDDVFALASHSSLGVKCFYSDSIQRITGVAVKEFYENKCKIYDFVHPEDRSKFLPSTEAVDLIKTKKKLPKYVTFRVVDIKGETRWIESRMFSFEEKDATHIGHIFRDITEQRKDRKTAYEIKQKAAFKEKLKIANKLKEEKVSSDIILKTTGIDINNY